MVELMLQKTSKPVFLMAVSILCAALCQHEVVFAGKERIEQDLQTKKEDFKRLLSDYSKAIDELDSTKIELEKGRVFSDGLKDRVGTLGSRLESLESELEKKHQMLSEEQNLKTMHATVAEELKLELDSVKTQKTDEIIKLSAQNNDLMNELSAERERLGQEIKDLAKKMDESVLVSENKDLSERQKKLEHDLKIATKQAKVLSEHMLKIRDKLNAEHETEKLALSSKLSKIEENLSKKEKESASLSKIMEDLRKQNVELGQKMSKINEQNRELKNSSATITLNFLQDRVAIEQATKDKLGKVKELAYLKVKKIEPKLIELESTKNELSTRLMAMESEKKELATQVDLLRKQLETKNAASKEAVERLFVKLKEEQLKYATKLGQIKSLVDDKVVSKNERLADFSKKTEQMMTDLIEQKRKFSGVFQELKIAQASIDAIKAKAKPTAEEIKDRKASEILAKNIEKLDGQVLSMREKEKKLFKELELARSESDLLKNSIDEMYSSNENLISKNEMLQSKLETSENSLLSLKDQARELTKRESELVDRVINLERQLASDVNFKSEKASTKLDERLTLAKADYAKLRQEVETLVDKLGSSNKSVDLLRNEALESKNQILALSKELDEKNLKNTELKGKVKSLLASLGLEGDLLNQDKKVEYLRLVTDYNLEKLTDSVLKSGKGKLDESLKVLLNDDLLASKMVKRAENNHSQLNAANIQGNFGKIFGQLHKNQIKAELSKLYGFFLARASSGRGEDEAFRSYKKLAAQYFSDPALEDVEIRNLADPTNPLIAKFES